MEVLYVAGAECASLLFPEQQIDDPAAADVRTVAAAVEQDIRMQARAERVEMHEQFLGANNEY